MSKPFHLAATSLLASLIAGCSIVASPTAPTTDPGTPAPSASATSSQGSSPPGPVSPFRSLDGFLRGRAGVVTAAVYDRRTNRLWQYHPGVLEYTASIVKVEIMGTALAKAQAASKPLPPGEAALIPPMIEVSNNDAATSMLADVGGPAAVLRFGRLAGMTETRPHSSAPIPGTPWPGWGLTTTTSKDQVAMLRRFAYPNQVLTSASRRYGVGLMKRVVSGQNWGVSAGVMPGTTVALKDGWIQFPLRLQHSAAGGWQINSIGWVHGHGRNYVIAVLTENNPSMPYGIATIQVIARSVYAQLGS